MELATRKFVRPEHLNHHHTFYAGYISECMTEAAFIALACTLGHTDHVVLAAMNDIRITKPTKAGEIVEILWEVSHVGTTSMEFRISGRNMLNHEQHFMGKIVFVTVDDEGKKTPHHLNNI
ncbi:MAG: acyl-CoA thioesterase [Eubacterium sp.]